MRKAFSEQVPSHIFVIFSYGTMKLSKTRTKPVYPSVWGQPRGKSETIVSWSESPIYRSKATRNGWMDGAGIYKRNTSEYYNSVTAGFAQNSNHGFFFFHLMSPLWTCSSEWMQESRSVFLHRFLKYFAGNISENVWQLSRYVNKRFIYSLSLKFRERISSGKF